MNAWKRILEIGFIWTRDIGAAFAARSLLGATCWRAGRDGFAKTSSMPEKKGGQRCAAREQRLCRAVALRFPERHLNALIAVLYRRS
jgi:hypothetical protein